MPRPNVGSLTQEPSQTSQLRNYSQGSDTGNFTKKTKKNAPGNSVQLQKQVQNYPLMSDKIEITLNDTSSYL